MDRFRFRRGEPDRPYDLSNVINREFDHGGGMVRTPKEEGSGLIYTHVGTLGGQQYGDQEGVGIPVLQWNRYLGIQFFQFLNYKASLFLFGHFLFNFIQ